MVRHSPGEREGQALCAAEVAPGAEQDEPFTSGTVKRVVVEPRRVERRRHVVFAQQVPSQRVELPAAVALYLVPLLRPAEPALAEQREPAQPEDPLLRAEQRR